MRPFPQDKEERLSGHQEQRGERPRRCGKDDRRRGREARRGFLRHAGDTPEQRRDKDAIADGLHLHAPECRPLCRGKYPEIRHDVPRQADDDRAGENKGAASVLDDGGRQGEERPVRNLRSILYFYIPYDLEQKKKLETS